MKKFLIIFIAIISISCFSVYKFFNFSIEKKISSSSIYKIVSEYSNTGEISNKYPIFSKSEELFVKGLNLYENNDFSKAKVLFKNSLELDSQTPSILLYNNFYLNQCEIEINGHGNFIFVENSLDIMKKYSIFSNETHLIWQLISSVATDINSRKRIIFLLENYIKEAKDLKLESSLKIKGFIAMMKMTNKEYGESIYMYYDILSLSEKIKDYNTKAKIQVKSYEYLGNMYFILEDYNSAIQYYEKAIHTPIKNKNENAISKYGAYINRSESYIQLKNYAIAEKCSLETEKIIPYLPKNIAVGVKVFRYKNLLLLESGKKNFKKAQEYYELCLKYLKDDKGSAFINSAMYVETAHCEMLYLKGEYEKAIEKLNILLKKDLEEEWGFDSYIYILLLKLYKETNQVENYFEVGKNLYKTEKEFTGSLKKDYINFIENSYILEQMKKQEKISQIKIVSLSGIILLSFISFIFGIAQIKKLNKKNFTDALTQIHNRKYMDYISKKILKKPIDVAVVMIDIDFFKNYNDFYGHIAGDNVIKKTAEVLRKSIQKEDILIRYGGEEFLLILKNADINIFEEIYKKITKNLQNENLFHEVSPISDKVTLSFGVFFTHFEKTLDLKESIKKADEALYLSKKNGKNRYTVI